jgi:hypothetical protein
VVPRPEIEDLAGTTPALEVAGYTDFAVEQQRDVAEIAEQQQQRGGGGNRGGGSRPAQNSGTRSKGNSQP